jgi:hypothetical protein
MYADRRRERCDQTPAVIVPTRALIAAWLLAACATACSGSGSAPIESRGSFEPPGGTRVEIRALVQPEHGREAPRYLRGAVAALGTVTPWLGPPQRSSITLADPPWHATAVADPSVTLLERTPWWGSATSMAPELAAARAIARESWSHAFDITALPRWFTAGLVEYTARRAVVPVFQAENLSPGYAMFEARYFGAFVPRFVRIRLLPDTDGDPLPAYRASPRVGPASPSSAAEERSLAGKTILTLNTLERWVGRPVFDGVLAEFARTSRASPPTLADFARVASASSGQNLSWLLDQAFGGSATFDYAVTGVSSVSNAAGGFDTQVVVARLGDGEFTGASAPRVGPFESGRGVRVAVVFADGERVVDAWDGRDTRKTFAYRSASRAESATVDPERTLLLDINRTNNSRSEASHGSAAATTWAARWLLWLEHALLTYAALA